MFQPPPTNPVYGKDEEPKFKEPKTGWATDKELADYIRCSRSQVWHLTRTHPTFPQPVEITTDMSRWSWRNIFKWERTLTSE